MISQQMRTAFQLLFSFSFLPNITLTFVRYITNQPCTSQPAIYWNYSFLLLVAWINNPIPIVSLHPVQSLPLLSQPFIIPSIPLPLPLSPCPALVSTISRLDAHHLTDQTRLTAIHTTSLNTTRPRNPNCDLLVTATSHDLSCSLFLRIPSHPFLHARTH